jgi:hypothetical protein
MLHQSSHAALQYSATAKRFLDGIFASLAQDVRNRDQIGAPSTLRDAHNADRETGGPPTVAGFMQDVQPLTTSTGPVSGIELLKGLSAQDDPLQAEEMTRIMESLPATGPSSTRRPPSAGPSTTSISAPGSMTPRRPGAGMGITPRKIGRLGSSTPRRERELSRGPDV